ncbi:hypothetical protein F511_23972 [Dorcoceras hygrometricum]|uniref:Uncharacterized protein n=1 Tax=Dorcoceras hygrometricum TaxID=472368 RepID=A0A2Z7AHY4_9LAMI|nr:hypothetical protein F511_23972 [Dorcoceras hygrometricum]
MLIGIGPVPQRSRRNDDFSSSAKTEDQPSRKIQCIQSQHRKDPDATMISAVAQRQKINPVARYSASSRSTMKRFYTTRLDCKGAKTRRRKETAVA